METNMSDNSVALAPANFARWGQPLGRLRRRSAPIELLSWPDHLLKDIGISRDVVALAMRHRGEPTAAAGDSFERGGVG
jgi:uncharacterized protein YjiS (DUF1127 family)